MLSSRENKPCQSPKTPLPNKQKMIVIDFNLNQHSQNDVQWGSPQLDTSIPQYEVEESPAIHKKRKVISNVVTTPARIIKRHASSPASGFRSETISKSEECKKLRRIFENDDDNSSQELDFNCVEDPFENSFDDLLSHIPMDDIAKEMSRGKKNVNIVFDPLAGASQVVREVTKPFERHNSLPASSTTKQISPENINQPRRCTPEEIAKKRIEALERLKKNNNGTVIGATAKTNLSNSGEL
jgi:hypothetical protein